MEYLSEGRKLVVNFDLEKFFDRGKHDILMVMLAKRIKAKELCDSYGNIYVFFRKPYSGLLLVDRIYIIGSYLYAAFE
jgi:hypothetical protein